jgi:hypothetical protein
MTAKNYDEFGEAIMTSFKAFLRDDTDDEGKKKLERAYSLSAIGDFS